MRSAERVEERNGLRLNGQETLLHFPAHGLAQCSRRVPAALIGGEWAQGWNISGTARLIDRHHGEEAVLKHLNGIEDISPGVFSSVLDPVFDFA